MAGGCGILQWVTTSAPTSISYHLKLENIRHEQMTSGCDREIDIEQPAGFHLQSLRIGNVRLEGPYPTSGNAIYTNHVGSLTVKDTSYSNNGSSSNHANFINPNNALYIKLENNYITPLWRIHYYFAGIDVAIRTVWGQAVLRPLRRLHSGRGDTRSLIKTESPTIDRCVPGHCRVVWKHCASCGRAPQALDKHD